MGFERTFPVRDVLVAGSLTDAHQLWSFDAQILLVHPEKGCTGAIVFESGKPPTHVPATPEKIEEVRTDLEKRRAGRK